jgi:hypothetical protein
MTLAVLLAFASGVTSGAAIYWLISRPVRRRLAAIRSVAERAASILERSEREGPENDG